MTKPLNRDDIQQRYGIDNATLMHWQATGFFPAAAIQGQGVELWPAVQVIRFETEQVGLQLEITT